MNETNDFYQATTAPDAEILADLGDRAVWLSSSRILYVVDGKRMLVVKMGSDPMKPSLLVGKARAVALAVLK